MYVSAIAVHYPDDLLWDVQGRHKAACKPINHSLLPFHYHTALSPPTTILTAPLTLPPPYLSHPTLPPPYLVPPSQTGYEIDFEHPANETDDRQTLYCVPIPAETPWAKEISSFWYTNSLLKPDCEMVVKFFDQLKAYCNTLESTEQPPMGVYRDQSPRLKRQLSGSGDEGEGMEVGGEDEGGEASSSFTTKKHRTEQPSSTGTMEPDTVHGFGD